MKKIKFFAMVALLGMSMNSFAQSKADGSYRYAILSANTAEIVGFVANHEEATVNIPVQVQDPDDATKKYDVVAIGVNAFSGQTGITSVTIPDTKVTTIKAGAFAGCTNLKTVAIGKAVTLIDNVSVPGTPAVYTQVAASATMTDGGTYYTAADGSTSITYVDGTSPANDGTNYWTLTSAEVPATIGAGAFEGCTSLTTITFGSPTSGTQVIAAGTFAESGIVTLDLTTSRVKVINPLFEEYNTTLTTIKLPATMTSIAAEAFKSLATLATIDFTACTTTNFSIGADAFSGAPLIKNITLPARMNNLMANSLRGSNIRNLTIAGGNISTQINATGTTKLETLTVDGNFVGTFEADAFATTTLTEITFGGTLPAGALKSGSFSKCSKLATVNFNGALAAAAVANGAFGDGTNYAGSGNYDATTNPNPLTINYKPAASVTAVAFGTDAFGDGTTPAATVKYAKLVTTTAYAAIINALTGASVIKNLKVDAAAATYALAVANGGSSKYYYAKLYANAPYKIAKKQGDATVVVYQGYVDQSDAAIYMENLRIINGYYNVPANTPVIIKTTAANDVVLTESSATEASSVMQTAGGAGSEIKVGNELSDVAGGNATGMTINEYYASLTPAQTPYALAPIADYGYLWTKMSDSRVLIGKTNGAYNPETKTTTADFVIACNNASAARLHVVWLDGSEDNTTAIQTVKQNVEDGVIYNLAGQKVDANFKGVVIKNGKKMIQK